jgi:DNA mismatch endonuclease (patch repair protein)
MPHRYPAKKQSVSAGYSKRYLAKTMPRTPTYVGLKPSCPRASIAARGSSKKHNTKPEVLLRSALRKRGLRYHKNRRELPGAPDIVFDNARLVVFADGDFWHGKNWTQRKAKLRRGHNSDYWVSKIERNMDRDLGWNRKLRAAGWAVLRLWESDICNNIDAVVNRIEMAIARRMITLFCTREKLTENCSSRVLRHRH